MKLLCGLMLTFVVWTGLAAATAEAHGCGRWSIGVGFGFPGCYGPWWGPCYGFGYYRPYPVYVAPAPVIVQPAPVYQTAPPLIYQAPAVQAQSAAAPPAPARNPEVQQNLHLLRDASDRARADAALQLGRSRSPEVVDPLAATLAGDRSPVVREAAARALGVIGSPHGLPALRLAAQNDADRNVRYSAQFAIDVIEAR